MTTTASAIWAEHLDAEQARRSGATQVARDDAAYLDAELQAAMIDLEDAGDAEAGAYLNQWLAA